MIEILDIAISKHTLWLKNLHLSLICDIHAEDCQDATPDAHEKCLFGRWFYSDGKELLAEFDATPEIERMHREMHDSARSLLINSDADKGVCSQEYEHFIDLAIGFKSRVRAMQNDFINQVCTVDQLTGAWNRHEMFNRLTQEAERNRRKGESCSLVMMDLDYFKRINDGYGHKAGDQVLKQLIVLCTEKLRTYDSVFRYGGEEFLFCFPGSDTEDAIVMVERLRHSVKDHPFDLGNGEHVHVTASFGIATMSTDKSLEDAMLEADHALLCAKSEGRDRYCVWET